MHEQAIGNDKSVAMSIYNIVSNNMYLQNTCRFIILIPVLSAMFDQNGNLIQLVIKYSIRILVFVYNIKDTFLLIRTNFHLTYLFI